MTRDPERLLSPASDADDLERELLASAGSVAPPAHARDEVWRKLAPHIAAAAATGTLVAGSAAAKAGVFGSLAPKTLAAKLAWSVAAGGLLVSGYFVEQRLSAPEHIAAPPRPAAPAPRPKPARAKVEVEAAQDPCAGEHANEPPCGANAAPPARAKRPEPAANSDRLRAESALLAAARAELRGGDPTAAQRTLDRLANRFPRGVLHQEREVLAIEVLAARGEREAAARRAAAFVRSYPESPHRDKVQGFLAPGQSKR